MSHTDSPDPDQVMLDNGELAATAEEVLAALTELDVENHTVVHEPLYTVEQAKTVVYDVLGAHTKNLFLRNKKGRMFLLVIEQDRSVDLRGLRDRLQTPGGHFAFASSERMGRYLGVVPGAVTPLAVINDHGGKVQLIVERGLLQWQWIYLHPCRNTHSTRIRTADLLRVVEQWQHPALLLDFD